MSEMSLHKDGAAVLHIRRGWMRAECGIARIYLTEMIRPVGRDATMQQIRCEHS